MRWVLSLVVAFVVVVCGLSVSVSMTRMPHGNGLILPSPDVLTRQSTPRDCGLASLATMARLLGVEPPPYPVLLARHANMPYGLSLADLVDIATELGLAVKAARVNPTSLVSIPLPAILHFRGNHFVVLVARSEDQWLIADPARGFRRLPRALVQQAMTGTALLVEGP